MLEKREFDTSKIKKVKIDKVKFNSWNPKQVRNDQYNKVLDSVRINGQMQPVVVREKGDFYEVIDGCQRLTAMIDLGYEEIYIYNEGEVSDVDAKALTIWWEQRVEFDNDMLGQLLIELKDQVELPYDDKEIELLAGVDIKKDDDDEFEDEFENQLKSFSISVLPDNKDFLKDFFKRMKEENSWSENTTIMTIAKIFDKNTSLDKAKIDEIVEEEKQKEIDF